MKSMQIERKVGNWYVGVLWNKYSFWVGIHYSLYTRRACINFVPCLTLYIVQPGGKRP